MSTSFVDVIVHASKEITRCPNGYHEQIGERYSQLLMALGYAASDVPVGELLRIYHGLSGSWCVASPMCWEATHRDVIMRDVGENLALSENESRRLFEAFSRMFSDDGMRMHYHDATTWLIQTDKHPLPAIIPPHLLVGQSMSMALKTLEKHAFWLRFITESQMFFSAEKTAINGLWLWGGQPLLTTCHRPLVVCGSQAWLMAAQQLSTHVTSFDKVARCARQSVYFVPDSAWGDMAALEHVLRDRKVRWHWQNVMYVSQPRSWLARFLAFKKV